MKLFLLSFLAISGVVLGQRNENPCLGNTIPDLFVNDWASCPDYFWCLNEKAFPAGPCREGFGFDILTSECTAAAVTCDQCPVATAEDPPLAVSLKKNN